MPRFILTSLALAALSLPGVALAQAKTFTLESAAGLRLGDAVATPVTFQGRKGLRVELAPSAPAVPGRPPLVVRLEGTELSSGTIEAEIAGRPGANAGEGARGFVGIAFRVQPDNATYDAFYLRPTNGRAEDQERRNHATQYISHPAWTWMRLRQETPSRYESYVDLVPDTWTKIRIEVRGAQAKLFVHDQPQPTLVVNDVKTGADAKGGVALWLEPGTIAHFRNVVVSPLSSVAPQGTGDTARALDWWVDDSLRMATLRRDGRSVAGRHAILWAPRDSITEDSLRAVLAPVEVGLAEVKRIIGMPLAWQRIADRPVQYYLAPDRFVSHASGTDAVFISLARVRSGKAPFLHEALHELLAPKPPYNWWEFADSATQKLRADSLPLWLTEGAPDYVAKLAASRTGIPDGDVFDAGGPATIDSVCAARVRANPDVAPAIALVGRKGRPAELFTTRRATVAPIFYPCSDSFTKYVVERIGVAGLVALFPALKDGDWDRRLAAAAAPLPELRRVWARKIGIPE